MEEDSVKEYLLTRHKTNILQILQDVDIKKHYSININFVELFENDTALGYSILKNPEEALDELDHWILYVQDILCKELKDKALQQKPNVHARVYGLPACPELHRNIFPKNGDLDLFLQVTGTVVRVTASKILEYQRRYMCTKCKHVEMIEAVYNQKYIITAPKKCTNPEKCPGTNLISVGDLNADNCKDYQEIKIQEQASKLGVGTMPSVMWVTLEDDLVDACKPGDDVTICGIVKRRWGPLVVGKKIEVELVLKANHIQVNNGHTSPSLITPELREQFIYFWEKHKSCPLEGRDLILKSFCPKLYGMSMVKLAIAVVLAGGSPCTQGNEMGIQIRSEPHILLVGDPGTGKSQLLRYAAKVIPRSILTTGVGTTSAGLTAAAVMEDGQWQLEGGALVLADGGICCIDEFNSMKSLDRTSIHEAMEQQTISVAKASMVCKLRTRCSVLAATNPKGGHLDPSQPLSLNLALPSPLLSRFDIVLMLKDCNDNEWDDLVADYTLSGKGDNAIKIDASLWNLETLQQYFTIIRSINPMLTPQANKILSSYYQAQRRAISRNKARTTVRLLDSLVRLSQAHARLMFHTEVHVMDALFAVLLIESSMHGECAVLSLDKMNVQAPFFAAPMEKYAQLVESVLSTLGLHDILRSEIMFLRNGCQCSSEVSCNNQQIEVNEKNNESSLEKSSSPNVDTKHDEGPSKPHNIEEHNAASSNIVNDFEITVESCKELNAVKGKFETSIQLEVTECRDITENESEIEKENAQRNKVYRIVEVINPKQQNKSTPATKKIKEVKNKIMKEVATTAINNHSSDNSLENKKRKSLKPHEHEKQPKTAKNTSTLNDFQMLNLIPSVNDEFDVSVLDFVDDGSAITASTNRPVKAENKNVNLDVMTSETSGNKNKENFSTSLVDVNYIERPTEFIVNKVVRIENKDLSSQQHVIKSYGSSKIFNKNATGQLSQNTKFKQFLEKFTFKPRNVPNYEDIDETTVKPLTVKNCDKVVTDSDNIVSCKTNQTQASQSVFKSQDQDYDSLDSLDL